MNDKTKRIILITVCCLLCGAAVIGIAGRFGGNTVTPSGTVSGSQPDSNDPNVNINNIQALREMGNHGAKQLPPHATGRLSDPF